MLSGDETARMVAKASYGRERGCESELGVAVLPSRVERRLRYYRLAHANHGHDYKTHGKSFLKWRGRVIYGKIGFVLGEIEKQIGIDCVGCKIIINACNRAMLKSKSTCVRLLTGSRRRCKSVHIAFEALTDRSRQKPLADVNGTETASQSARLAWRGVARIEAQLTRVVFQVAISRLGLPLCKRRRRKYGGRG